MAKSNNVYITGHKNPDTDSIASSIAYAELKNKATDCNAIPIRIGEISKETRFVLDYFNVEAPAYMDTMAPKVVDLDFDNTYGVSESLSIKKTLEIIKSTHMNSVPIVDSNEVLKGIVSLSAITNSYMEVWDDKILGRANTSLSNICEALTADIIYEPKDRRPFSGAMKIFSNMVGENNGINENDIVIVGNNEDEMEDAIKSKVSLLILTDSSKFDDDLEDLVKENKVTVISTNFDSFMAARLLPQSIPVSYIMEDRDIVFFYLDDYIEDVKLEMTESRYRTYPVVDHEEKVVGTISRYHLIAHDKKNLILVDHNEASQSIDGLEYANIVEIIDHHRVDAVTTDTPIYFRNMPLGSTATIVGLMFFELGVLPSRETAGLLSAAIISDTLLFRSPTSTKTDKAVLRRLAKIADIDPEEFSNKMFKAGTSFEKAKPTELLKRDVKLFTIKDETVRVAQVFSTEIGQLVEFKERLINRMEELLEDQNEDIYILIMTDIFKEMSEIIVVGKYANAIANEFGQKLTNSSFIADGVLSRKKQVIPNITNAIAKAKSSEENKKKK